MSSVVLRALAFLPNLLEQVSAVIPAAKAVAA